MRYLHAVLLLVLVSACAQRADPTSGARTEGFVTVGDGIRIYYVEQGSGPETLVAPAAFYLEPLLLDALSANRRVVLYDVRNRGRSGAADLENVSLERQIEDLEELRISLGIDRMQLLGWSTYGMEMAVYALRYPERVSRLVQISPLAPAAEIMEQHRDTRRKKMDRAAIDALEERFGAGEFDDSPGQYCRQLNELTTPASFVNVEFAALVPDDCDYPNEWPMTRSAYFRAFFATLGDFDWRDDLQELQVPRLIIHGREDGIPLAGAEAWAAAYDNARLLVVSPAGHFPFVEQKETVIAAIDTFLGGDWPDNATSGGAPR